MTRLDEINDELNLLFKTKDDIIHQISTLHAKRLEIHLNNNKKFIGKVYKSKCLNNITYYKILNIDEKNEYRMQTLVINVFNESLFNIKDKVLISIENYPWFCFTKSGEKMVKQIDLPEAYEEVTDEDFLAIFNEGIAKLFTTCNIKLEDDSNE